MIEDEENLPFQENSFDLIISDLMLHTSNNLKTSLEKIHALLKPDGLMLCTMFGSETLRELKDCLLRAEEQFKDKVYPRINPFADIRTAGDILQSSGFKLCVVDDTPIRIISKDVHQLINLIRSMGENNYINIDKPNISRNIWNKTSELMKGTLPEEDGVISTFEILTLTGWKYHADQPKPLRPGSAKISLADFFDK
jgi:SAM-dependent methyltransferase